MEGGESVLKMKGSVDGTAFGIYLVTPNYIQDG